MASPIHLTFKYHNIYDDPMMISTNLYRAKTIYKALQQVYKKGEGKAIEIKVASLIRKLRDMAIRANNDK